MQPKLSQLRRSTLLLIITLAATFWGCARSTSPTQDPEKRYNVLMIVSDALRQDVLGCYGGRARTPNIDALAQNGILFENAFSTSPWTSPSAVSMFTANYATSYGVCPAAKTQQPVLIQIFVPDTIQTFFESLEQLDYHTCMQVENLNVLLHNCLQGITGIYLDQTTRAIADTINRITGGGLFDSFVNSDGYQHVYRVLSHLLEMPAEDNFFMLHWIMDPHAPYDPAEKFMSQIRVDESQLTNPIEYYSQNIFDKPGMSPVERQYVIDLYIAEVESVDERVGFLIKMLEHKNLLENTYIVFTSDHGEMFGHHGKWGHGGRGLNTHYYEGLVRVPLIVTGPGLARGKRIKDNISLLDLMPTLKECLGVEYEEDVQGRSFRSLLFQGTERPATLYFDNVRENEQIDALVEGSYKLIALKNSRNELYDIFSDPFEKVNLATRNPTLASTLYEKLLKIRTANQARQKVNIEALDFDVETEGKQVGQEVLDKLKSLGYIK